MKKLPDSKTLPMVPKPSGRSHHYHHHHQHGRHHRNENWKHPSSKSHSAIIYQKPTYHNITPIWIKIAAICGIVLSLVAFAVAAAAIVQGLKMVKTTHVKEKLTEKQLQLDELKAKNNNLTKNLTNLRQKLFKELDKHHKMLKDSHGMKKSLDSLLINRNAQKSEKELLIKDNVRLKKNISLLLTLIRKNSAYTIEQANRIIENISTLQDQIEEAKKKTQANDERISKFLAKKSCKELQVIVGKRSGVYEILIGNDIVEVFCDMRTDGGGWMVIQRRDGGIVDFFQDFETYVKGFGDKYKEYWLGLNYLNLITKSEDYELRIDLEDWDGNETFAQYQSFAIGDRSTNYKLTVTKYSGDAGDSLTYHNNRPFSTKNRDNDGALTKNCAKEYHGAWWYGSCHASNLNGEYVRGGKIMQGGVNWWFWKDNWYSFKKSEMKIRPK